MDSHWEVLLDIDNATDFRRLVMDKLNLLRKRKSFKFHVEQCKSLSSYILDKLSPYVTDKNTPYLCHDVCSKSVQRAWKEIYRAVNEAETYLKHCSTDSGWMKCCMLANTGEAFALHIHDLAWSLLCLDLALLNATQKCIGRLPLRTFRNEISDFFAEMSGLYLEQYVFKFLDCWHLLLACNQMAANDWNFKQRIRIKVLLFIERKLLEAIKNECKLESGSVIPSGPHMSAKDLVKKKIIGGGSFGQVYEASWLGHKVAVKSIPIDAPDLFEREISVLAKLQSPFVVQLIGTCIEGRHCYIVMEMVSFSLDKLLMSSGSRAPLALPVAVDMMLQISRGMEYLHSQGIMHMDLKASNILIEPSVVPQFGKRGYGRVKLCDFGMASLRLSSFRCEDPKGTCYWRAPEAFPFPKEELLPEIDNLEQYTYKADVYSFAMTCYEILTGNQPFVDVHPKDLYRLIVQGRRPTLQPPSCPTVLADYIAKCWQTNPRHRPCFAQISSFLRNMKLFILSGSDPRYVIQPEVTFKEEGFDESPADEKLELIIRVLHTVRPEIKRRYDINTVGRMPSDTLSVQKDHPLPVFLYMRDCYDLQDVFQSTNEVLGKGGLKSSPHRANSSDFFLLVKRLSKDPRYLRRLLRALGSLKYLNLRSLPPSCLSEEERPLIYNYGTLYSLLHSRRKALKWDKRIKIAVNVAAWLAFLHKFGTPHGNVNSSNILLDEDGNACLADSNCSSGIVRNTSNAEYTAPEQAVTGNISEESDVYSFGVLLVELFTGRNPRSPANTDLAAPNRRTEVSDMMLMGYRRTVEIIRGMLAVAMLCASRQLYTRPLMSDVVKMIHAVQNSNGRLMLPPIMDSFLSPNELLFRLCRSELFRVHIQLPNDSINEDGMGKQEPGHSVERCK